MPAKFIIHQRDNYYSFHFEGTMQNIILFSRLFRTNLLCRAGINELLQCCKHPDYFEKKQDNYGQYSFVVRNKKAIMLGHSPTYYASSSRDYAMKQLMNDAAMAIIKEDHDALMDILN